MTEVARLVYFGKVLAVESYGDGMLLVDGLLHGVVELQNCTVLTDDLDLTDAVTALPDTHDVKHLPLKAIPFSKPSPGHATHTLSYSAISTFKTCPRQFQHLYVLKDVKRTTGAAALWGVEIHKQLEDYLREGESLKDDMAKREMPYINGVRARHVVRLELVEHQWGLDDNWRPVDFHDQAARLRGVIDWLVVSTGKAIITDHKTGKRKPDDFAQMDIFALAVFCIYPQVQSVRGVYFWLKQGDTPTYRDYTRDQLGALKESVTHDLAIIDETDEIGEWPMRPSGLCRGWCPAKQCPAYRERN